MKLHHPQARTFIPDGTTLPEAIARVTHLGIGAHQDDLEFMAFHGIMACVHSGDHWFGGVTCTDGAGSSRTGDYANFTDEQMQAVRVKEQEMAATIGRYGCMIQLGHPSSVVKDAHDTKLVEDLEQIVRASQPTHVYTHNPADKHPTHIGVVVATVQAIRRLPVGERPQCVYGCEVWRGLDWMADEKKVVHDVSAHENLAAALNGVFDSQIAGGKRYDLATLGRRRANATFFNSHATNQCEMAIYAMDLTPLIQDDTLDLIEYVTGHIREFERDVAAKLSARLGH